MSDIKYNTNMKRMGRPPTGHQPRMSIRIVPGALDVAREGAKAAGKTLGVWVAEAIQEKAAREATNDNSGN